MLDFKLEWESGPEVRDELQRASWARLEIRASSEGGEVCLTDCLGLGSGSLRSGVYGSAFPLARWIVDNWWALMSEGVRGDPLQGGRALAANPKFRPWVQRHNLLAARNGFALPDLALHRDGDHHVLRCVPDPVDSNSTYPVRFITRTEIRLPVNEVAAGLRRFINAVADRVHERASVNSDEARELQDDWRAIGGAVGAEEHLCKSAAAMGLDPYDPRELTDEIAALIEGPFAELAPALQRDLADCSSGSSLYADLTWVREAIKVLGESLLIHNDALPKISLGKEEAHQCGYRLAREYRARRELPGVIEDLEAIARGGPFLAGDPVFVAARDGVASRIKGLVVLNDAGSGRLVSLIPRSHSTAYRFLLARALFLIALHDSHHIPLPIFAPRLLTSSNTWIQRASRAFAAELLAPSDELSRRMSGMVSDEDISRLAGEFQVSEMVVARQIENHRLAMLVDSQ